MYWNLFLQFILPFVRLIKGAANFPMMKSKMSTNAGICYRYDWICIFMAKSNLFLYHIAFINTGKQLVNEKMSSEIFNKQLWLLPIESKLI